jgi:hypothetical protein
MMAGRCVCSDILEKRLSFTFGVNATAYQVEILVVLRAFAASRVTLKLVWECRKASCFCLLRTSLCSFRSCRLCDSRNRNAYGFGSEGSSSRFLDLNIVPRAGVGNIFMLEGSINLAVIK